MGGSTQSEQAGDGPELAGVVRRNIQALLEVRKRLERRKSRQEAIADAITRFTGSMTFVYLHAAIFGGWILVNTGVVPGVRPFDPFPFVMLAMIASVEAIFLSTFVLISQNRMAALADKRADLDLQINLLSEHEITRLIELVDAIADHLGVQFDGRAILSDVSFDIREGEMFLLPPRIPHSPQRPAGTVGLVLERRRNPGEIDKLLWFCDHCGAPLHEAGFPLKDIGTQIKEAIGSGPYVFKKDEYKPGVQSIYLKNTKYVPRSEPPSGLAGGKKVFVDRIEWLALKDAQTQLNALLAGEIDMIEQPAFEQYPQLRKDNRVSIVDTGTVNYQYVMRFNHLVPPFNNPKVREAAMWAMNQEAFLRAQVGPENEGMFYTCPSMYPCGTPLASPKGSDFMVKGNMAKAQQLLKDSGYDGKPIVVMRPTDLQSIHKLPLVATQLLRQAGFKVDLITMDWGSLVARRSKKDPADQGGWNIFLTAWVGADIMNPLTSAPLGGNGEKGWAGWATDAELEKLRDQYARATTEADKKRIAEAVQVRATQVGTHAILGEYKNPAAVRKNISGVLKTAGSAYWNIQKN